MYLHLTMVTLLNIANGIKNGNVNLQCILNMDFWVFFLVSSYYGLLLYIYIYIYIEREREFGPMASASNNCSLSSDQDMFLW